jgi:hypothetical protein
LSVRGVIDALPQILALFIWRLFHHNWKKKK